MTRHRLDPIMKTFEVEFWIGQKGSRMRINKSVLKAASIEELRGGPLSKCNLVQVGLEGGETVLDMPVLIIARETPQSEFQLT